VSCDGGRCMVAAADLIVVCPAVQKEHGKTRRVVHLARNILQLQTISNGVVSN
jgi:hypothetical protein